MTFEEAILKLEESGNEKTKKMYISHGSNENAYGVKLGDLRALAKKIKIDHELALKLWVTNNFEAMMLATMIIDAKRLSENEIMNMINPVTFIQLRDEFNYNVMYLSDHNLALREKLSKLEDELLGRLGWNLYIYAVMDKKEKLDLNGLYDIIEREMKDAQKLKQEAMNRCLVEIAVRHDELRERAIAIAEKIGKIDDRPVPKGCTSSYAPEWIAAVLRRTQKN